LFKFLLFINLALFSLSVLAADSAYTWLAKMNEAAKNLNYEGVFVYLHENQIEAMRVVHSVTDGSMRERLYSLNGEAREIIRDDRQVWCYLPNRKIGVHEYRKVIDQPFPSILPNQIDVLGRSYDIRLGKTDRIVDRGTQLIIVRPKDAYRYGYHLWADQATGLLLKADLVDRNGRAVEQYVFTQVRIGAPINETALAPRTPKDDLVWHGEKIGSSPVVEAEEEDNWIATKVPQGYTLTTNIKRYMPLRNTPVRHLVYSDGIAAVSIFIEKLGNGDARPLSGLSRMGAVHVFGTIVDGHQVTVVGEVPAITVDMVGRSVARR